MTPRRCALGDKGSEILVSVDALSEGVDFRLSEVAPQRIGRKALAVNLSDIAAMAARPLAVVVSVVLPRDGGLELAQQLAEGMLPLAEKFDVAFAGGDTNSWDQGLVISVTIFGEPTPRGPLQRAGAKPGDVIIVTGAFGGSILGHQFDFEPRVAEALALHERYELHAGIDVSDGLSLDLSRLARRKWLRRHVLDARDRIPIAEAAHELSRQRWRHAAWITPLRAMARDFELVLAVPPGAQHERMLAEQPL